MIATILGPQSCIHIEDLIDPQNLSGWKTKLCEVKWRSTNESYKTEEKPTAKGALQREQIEIKRKKNASYWE